jgi:hypothetical protein
MAKRTPAYAGILAKPLPDLRRYIVRLPEKDQPRARVALRLFQAHNLKDRIDELFKHYGMIPPRSAGIAYTREQGPVGDPWGVTDDAAPWCNLAFALASDHVDGFKVAGATRRGRPSKAWPEARLARLWIDVGRSMLEMSKQDATFATLRGRAYWNGETEAALEAAWRRAQRDVLGGALEPAPKRILPGDTAAHNMLAAFLALAEAFFPEVDMARAEKPVAVQGS